EASFFEMIRLYRENVSELKYVKHNGTNASTYENRQVLREIFKEFIECYREIKRFSNSKDEEFYINPNYAKKLKEIKYKANINANIIEMAIIDLAFMIVFYGLSSEGEQIIKGNIIKKYNRDYYYKLIYFIKLKPKKSNTERFNNWTKLFALNTKECHVVIDKLYAARKNPHRIDPEIPLATDFNMELRYEKYYGGHQFRLGHYFRHLFQSYKYLNNHPDLTDKEKYEYGKMYRAQLSTYEQALLLVNSISSLGMKWELTPENLPESKKSTKLITKYNLIKNLPGKHLSGIRYATYYPQVSYESDENT
ncbi:putative phage abortive infection protein, partial [Pseudomonas sp.]|uniref:putative phage abortive infection protein n=2 Tax=Pseudomonas TaxID=286 RepID=UPI00271F2E52